MFILPGQKKKGLHYNEIKKTLLVDYPIPSQVVLQSTISRGKNLRSIISKILIQINAKRGGIPWSVSQMPFTEKPTMIVGVSQVKFNRGRTIYGIYATTNNEFNRGFSKSEI